MATVLEDFVRFLAENSALDRTIIANLEQTAGRVADANLRSFWDISGLSANDFADQAAAFYDLPRTTLAQMMAGRALAGRFSRRFLRETMIFPYQLDDGRLRLAVADPSDRAAVRAAEIVLARDFAIEVGSFEDIGTVLDERLGDDDATPAASEAGHARDEDDIEGLRDLASGAPVVRAVNDLLEKAIETRATDIHIEPFRNGLVVRMRVDGLLRQVPSPPNAPAQAVLSRIKILAGLNIAERRLPQDGAARLRVARAEIDVRVATMPTQHGESAVIRILPRDRGLLELPRLGLSTPDERRLQHLLSLPHGMIVVTGPTGSGKTTSLATMLTILNDTTRKILTIEDPVEYEIHGINQSQVKPGIGLTFANALRAFVRQDPDVIMVGEVRDAETANVAIHAALTGHLVLTTLHTETAAAALPRLLDLGVEGFLLQSTLRAVIAQRLVRLLCERCKVERPLTEQHLALDPRYALLGFHAGDHVFEPGGCERCSNTGYRGRMGVFEVLEITGAVRELIGPQTDSLTVEKAAIAAGMTTMIDDAIAKCRAGVTSAAEVLRVTTVR